MNPRTVLVNYRISTELKREFERACHQLNISMTTQVNLLMRQFIARQAQATKIVNSDEPLTIFASWED